MPRPSPSPVHDLRPAIATATRPPEPGDRPRLLATPPGGAGPLDTTDAEDTANEPLRVRSPLTGEWVELRPGWERYAIPAPPCPCCGAPGSARIGYGLPMDLDTMLSLEEAGLLVLAGCCVDRLDRQCHACRCRWIDASRLVVVPGRPAAGPRIPASGRCA